MKAYSRVCARIDLDAVEYNIEMMRHNVREGAKMLGVVKTDGYGHGAVQIAKMLSPKDYMWGFAVATLDEALVLRRAGIEKPLLALGCIFPDQREEMIKHDIRMTLYTEEMAREVSDLAVKMGKQAYIHIKLDTGMSRLGFMIEEETAEIIKRISKMPNLAMEGMYTHFAKADEIDKSFTEKQIKNYVWMKETLAQRGVTFQYYHCSNSAGIIDVPEANMDLVRAGISTYGLYPSEEVHKENVPLKPAMELISHVAHVKWVEAGTPVSYGGTYITDRKTKIATIPVGYGDGYPRSLSNKGYVLIHGKKAPILGRVCMDQFMVDATEIDDVKYADKVTLVGNDGDEKLPVEALSGLSGRFNYEFVCDLGKRIPREFIRHGDIVEQMDYFA
ncbi:alanine racemase [Clostridium sp. AF15-17LB]|nr:alanine racemase [Clostridium sp. AF15-17LB]